MWVEKCWPCSQAYCRWFRWGFSGDRDLWACSLWSELSAGIFRIHAPLLSHTLWGSRCGEEVIISLLDPHFIWRSFEECQGPASVFPRLSFYLASWASLLYFSLSFNPISVPFPPAKITVPCYLQSCPLSRFPRSHQSARAIHFLLRTVQWQSTPGIVASYWSLPPVCHHCSPSACSQICNSRIYQILCPASVPLHVLFPWPDFSSLDLNPSVTCLLWNFLYMLRQN